MTGNFFDGWLAARKSANIPIFYVACGNDTGDLEWLRKTRLEKASAAFLDGDLVVPGFTKDVAPDNAISEAAVKPHLNVLTFGPEDAKGIPQTLKVPEALTTQWFNHPIYGQQYQNWVNQFYEEFGPTAADEPEQWLKRRHALVGPWLGRGLAGLWLREGIG